MLLGDKKGHTYRGEILAVSTADTGIPNMKAHPAATPEREQKMRFLLTRRIRTRIPGVKAHAARKHKRQKRTDLLEQMPVR